MVNNGQQELLADDEMTAGLIEMIRSLPDGRKIAFAQSMAMYQETSSERDKFAKDMAALKRAHADEITALKQEHVNEVTRLGRELSEQDVRVESLQRLVDTLENRAKTHQDERDRAVDRRADLQALFTSIMAAMRAFDIENAPLQQTAG